MFTRNTGPAPHFWFTLPALRVMGTKAWNHIFSCAPNISAYSLSTGVVKILETNKQTNKQLESSQGRKTRTRSLAFTSEGPLRVSRHRYVPLLVTQRGRGASVSWYDRYHRYTFTCGHGGGRLCNRESLWMSCSHMGSSPSPVSLCTFRTDSLWLSRRHATIVAMGHVPLTEDFILSISSTAWGEGTRLKNLKKQLERHKISLVRSQACALGLSLTCLLYQIQSESLVRYEHTIRTAQ